MLIVLIFDLQVVEFDEIVKICIGCECGESRGRFDAQKVTVCST